MKVGDTIFDKKMEIVRKIRESADLRGQDPDHVVELCHEVLLSSSLLSSNALRQLPRYFGVSA